MQRSWPRVGSGLRLVRRDGGRMKPTAQREVIERMQRGETLMWHGNAGPQISGRPFWPQKRTVRAMLRAGLLVWGRHFNETQKELGICPLILSPNVCDHQQPPASGAGDAGKDGPARQCYHILCSGAARRSRQAGARCLHNWVDQTDGTRICWRCGALWPLAANALE